MGVDLGDLVVKHKIELESLSGKAVAVDALNTIYQFLASIRQEDGTPLMDSKKRVTGHLSGLYYRSVRLVKAGVKPVYVFDGEAPGFKEKTQEERREVRKEAARKWKKALKEEKLEEARKYAQASSRLTNEMVRESKELLTLMGIPWVQAPSEGEAQAAHMVSSGVCHAAASQDYDSLLFGSPVLVRNLSITGKRKVPRQNRWVEVSVERIGLEETLKGLELGRGQLVLIGILCGTDYNEGIKGVGPKTALKIVKEHDTLDAVKGHVKEKYSYEFEENVDAIFRFFMEPPVEDTGKVEWGEVDREGIMGLLVDRHEFSPERVENALGRMESRVKEEKSQKKLDSWF